MKSRNKTLVDACMALLLGIAAFFLFTEHQVHVFGVLPYLLFALCPLMHVFMHHGHHHSHPNAK